MAKLFIPGRLAVTAHVFVEFWEPLYVYPLEPLYTENIGKPLTPRRVRALYYWKNGGRLSDVTIGCKLDRSNGLKMDTSVGG